MDIGNNIRQIRELRNYTQEYVAQELGISQASYARIEKGTIIPKTDRLQRIAEILEVDLSTLLNTTNNFNYHAPVHQSGYYINNQNNSIDIELIRNIIREELKNLQNT